MSITTEIDEAIQRNLPQQVGDQLKKRLMQAEQNEKDLEKEKSRCAERTKEIEALQKDLRQVESDLVEALSRNNTAEAVEQKLRNQKVFELETALAAKNEIIAHTREVNLALTRNLEYRKRCTEKPDVYGGDTTWRDGQEHRDPYVPVPGSESTVESIE